MRRRVERELIGMWILGSEDGLEIMNESGGKLIWGGGLRAIRIDKMGDPFFSISLNNGMVKESGVAVAKDGPIFFWLSEGDRFLLWQGGHNADG